MGCRQSKSTVAYREKQIRFAMNEIERMVHEKCIPNKEIHLMHRYQISLRKIIHNAKGYHMEHFYHDVKTLIENMESVHPNSIHHCEYLTKLTLQILDPIDLFDIHQDTPASQSSFNAIDTMVNAISFGKSVDDTVIISEMFKHKHNYHRQNMPMLKKLVLDSNIDSDSHSEFSCDYGFYDWSDHGN